MKDQKVLTTVEFEKLTEDGQWKALDAYEILDTINRPVEELGIEGTEMFGCVSRTHKHPSGITITYSERFTYMQHEPGTFDSSSDGVDDYLVVDGCTIVDEDGDKLIDPWEIQYYIPTTFMEVPDLSELAEPGTEIVSGGPCQGERFEVRRSYRPTLEFYGKLIASEQTSTERSSCYYSGRVGHWELLEVYQATSNEYVACRTDYTLWQGQKDLYRAQVCKNMKEVREFFDDDNTSQGYGNVVECILEGVKEDFTD